MSVIVSMGAVPITRAVIVRSSANGSRWPTPTPFTGKIENHAIARGCVGFEVFHAVENAIDGFVGSEDGTQSAALGQAPAERWRVSGLAQVVIGRSDKADLVAVLQVHFAKPLEVSVLGHDLDQRF